MRSNEAIFITRTGPPESLELREIPVPEPEPGEVRVRVHAVGVNFADVVARRGLYPGAPKRPFVPGYEIAGVVDAVGSEVTAFRPGERVLAMTRFGGYASYVCVPDEVTLPLPEAMGFIHAAAMPLNFITAFYALFHTGQVRRGSRVLIHAASGGVGLTAVQLAKRAGAVVFGTAGSDEKVAFLRQFGVDHPINYRREDFAARVKAITQGEGVDVILDSVGGSQLRRDLRILRPGGRLVSLGVATLIGRNKLRVLIELLRFPRLSVLRLLQDSLGVHGVNFNKLIAYPDLLRDLLQQGLHRYRTGEYRPVIARTFPLRRASDAHRMMENRAHIGKLVLIPSEGDDT